MSPERGGSRPWVDVVLHPGFHSWNVRGGWLAAVRRTARLGRVFVPEAKDDGGLARYLADPCADMILLLGFDNFLGFLHASERWVDRWHSSPLLKVGFFQETVIQDGRPDAEGKALSALACLDLAVYHCPADMHFFLRNPVASRYLPFGVDEEVFRCVTPFAERRPTAYFRGKVAPWGLPHTYQRRREILVRLQEKGLLEVEPFTWRAGHAEAVADGLDRRQVSFNPPSVFSGHTTRVYESMACGCAVVTPRPADPLEASLFRDGEHLRAYDPEDDGEAVRALEELRDDPEQAGRLAHRGRDEVLSRHTLVHRLRQVLDWGEELAAGSGPCRSHPKGRRAVPPIHFITPVSGTGPGLEAIARVLESLPVPWKWHLVEDPSAGLLPPLADARELAGRDPGRIALLADPRDGQEGLLPGLNTLLKRLPYGSILWLFPADERWLPEQIMALRDIFLRQPGKAVAGFTARVGTGMGGSPERLVGGDVPWAENIRVWRVPRDCRFKDARSPRLYVRIKPAFRWRPLEACGVERWLADGPREVLWLSHPRGGEGDPAAAKEVALLVLERGQATAYLPRMGRQL